MFIVLSSAVEVFSGKVWDITRGMLHPHTSVTLSQWITTVRAGFPFFLGWFPTIRTGP
jgi:hypothetical protein